MNSCQPNLDAVPAPVNTAEVLQQHAHSLLNLPRDVQLCILARCGTSDLAAVAVTCSRLRSLARTDELWRPAAEHAIAGKPALAELFRAVIADAHWLQWQPSVPCDPETRVCPSGAAVQATAVAAAQWVNTDGGEWLLTRNGTRLRLLSIRLRHTEPGVPEACLSLCRDVLQMWLLQEQGRSHATTSSATVGSHFAERNNFHLQHALRAFRLAAAIVADSIALQLRNLLMASSRKPAEQAQIPGPAWGLVHAAAEAFDSWVRSVAFAVGSLRQKRRADSPDDLSIGGNGAAAFRSQVLLAYRMRRELQREAAAVLWRLCSQPGCERVQAAAPAADVVQMQRLAMEHRSSQAAAQARQPVATVTELQAEVAAMAQLLVAFDVADEQRSHWCTPDGTHASALLQRHFGFVLRAGQRLDAQTLTQH